MRMNPAPSFTAGRYGVNELGQADALWSHRKTIKSIELEFFYQKQASAAEWKISL